MAKSDHKAKDAAMAAYMKENGPRAPQEWGGNGVEQRRLAKSMGTSWMNKDRAAWRLGMLGGMLAYASGLSKENPMDTRN